MGPSSTTTAGDSPSALVRAIADRAFAPILVVEGDGTLLYVNPAGARTLDCDRDDPQSCNVLDLVHPADRHRVTRDLRLVTAGVGNGSTTACRVRGREGWRNLECTATNMVDDQAVRGVLVTTHDVTARIEQEELLRELLERDPLTGLPNRTVTHAAIAEALAAGRSLSVAHLDLDRFKLINDSLGHSAGDAALRIAAERLLACLGPAAHVGHFSGDQFVLVLADVAADDADLAAWRAVERVAEPFQLAGQEVILAASVGLATSTPSSSAETMLRDADVALQDAKRRGGRQVRRFTPELRRAAVDRLTIEARLRRALDADELRLAVQPIVSLPGAKACGAEVLLRWEPEPGSFISPVEFISVAEQTGLIVPIGEWVIRATLRALADPAIPLTSASVNLSPRQLATPGLASAIARDLATFDVDPTALAFEITETLLIEQPEFARRILDTIRGYGCRIGLDDFGTGYSSLSYLRRLPLDFLKLDRTLIEEIAVDGEARAVVSAAVSMAHALGLDVVAEGVERPEQSGVVASIGCDFAQGYLYGRPELL